MTSWMTPERDPLMPIDYKPKRATWHRPALVVVGLAYLALAWAGC